MQGLAFFTKVSGGGINLASWHSPHSLTWSWILSIRRHRNGEGRWAGFRTWKTNVGRQWLLQVARCTLQWHRQRPMWYREMYQRLRDRRDEALGDDRPLPHGFTNPAFMDGGNSLH